ncbi:MAG TPA: porin family protein [Syntrophobacteria bacterium]|nr:porin family protein [Syntrophobacteria bacterium]
MKKLVTVVAVLSAIAFRGSMVYADAPATRFYFGAGASYSWEDFRNTDGLNVDNAGGVGFYGGCQLARYLALEANYDWHADFDLKYGGSKVGSISDLQTLMVDAKGMYPIGRFVPYIQVGAGWMWAKAEVRHDGNNTSDDFAWNIGLGLEHYLTPNVSLSVDHKYVLGTGDVDDLRYHQTTLRLTYHL